MKQIFCKFNNTEADYPKDKTIHQLFEAQVEKTPENIAVIAQSPECRMHSIKAVSKECYAITYNKLNERSNQLANLLRTKGVKPDTIVGLMVERSIEMMVGIFGILKAGGAYLPISPSNPGKRISYILSDSGSKIVLTQGRFLDKLYKDKVDFLSEIINLEDEKIYTGYASNLTLINQPNHLVYVIYTSGSTGNPKGVMIAHRSLVNRLNWMQKRYPLSVGDTILQKTPFFFDVSVWEMFWWSLVGASVCFLMPGGEKFPQAIVETVENNDVTVMHFVPSMMSVFLEYLRHSEEEVKRLATLKQIFASGEKLTPSHVQAFNEILHQKNGTRLSNLYGPTEATVDVTYFDCPTGTGHSSGDIDKIPIGKPIDNIELYILGEGNRIHGVGETGELCIAGVGVGRGYLNNPELTAEKFDRDFQDYQDEKEKEKETGKYSFTSLPLYPSTSLYRTGDLARWLPDGNVEFLGRRDHQVKIHGLRIELGEIETVMSKHPLVRDCVIVVKHYSRNIAMIVGYIVTKSGEEVSVNELKDYMKTLLPDYMVPKMFVIMDRFPLTPNGKVDRKALPEPTFSSPSRKA